MGMTRRMWTLGGGCALVFLIGGAAHGQQLTTAESKCIDGYNNKLRLVSQQAGKSARACIKNAGKGTEANPDNCILTNPDGKIAAKEVKVCELYPLIGTKCLGSEPIQQGCATGNAAHRGAIEDLAHDLFLDDGAMATATVFPGKTDAKCQDKAIQRATQLFTEKMKQLRKCKKDKMKLGAVVDEASLEAQCMTPTIPDPVLKIQGKRQKLLDDVNANCGTTSIPARFPGVCSSSGSTAALGACIEARVECRVCEALNAADGTNRNCDEFDDGVVNGSCGLTSHACVLNPVTSTVSLYLAFGPPQTFNIDGQIDIAAGGNVAECLLQPFDPIPVSSIGTVCITPGPPCATGQRWCGPGAGPPLGVDWQTDGNIGSCTNNAACQTSCALFCPPGTQATGGCTGHCSGGAQGPCTSDAQCTAMMQNLCNGPDPVAPVQNNICQCHCVNTAAWGPSAAGDMQCQISVSVKIEFAAPCDGTDILLDAGTQCGPISTQRANALITDKNTVSGGGTIPSSGVNDQTGVEIPCATVDTSTLTGLTGVAVLNFLNVPAGLGDASAGLKAECL